jgi:hypothetical protein
VSSSGDREADRAPPASGPDALRSSPSRVMQLTECLSENAAASLSDSAIAYRPKTVVASGSNRNSDVKVVTPAMSIGFAVSRFRAMNVSRPSSF